MIISPKHKYIFIAVPKTGSTTVEDYLLKNDDTAILNRALTIDEEGKVVRTNVNGHVRSAELHRIMMTEYDDYRVFGFVRNPYAKTVSAYFFYKNGKPIVGTKNKRKHMAQLNILLARILPFSIWSLLAPLKTNIEYLTDQNGKIIVDYIGDTDHLNEHFKQLIIHLKLPFPEYSSSSRRNTSKHKGYQAYFKNRLHSWLFRKKYQQEFQFYEAVVEKNIPHEHLRNLKLN